MVRLVRTPIGDLSSPFSRIRFFSAARFIPNADGEDNASPGDYFAPINTKDRIPVSKGAKQQNALDSAELQNYVAEMTAEIVNSVTANLTVVLTPPFEDAVHILENRLIRRDSIIVAQWGYSTPNGLADSISRPFVFMALEPEVEISDTEVTITLKGVDLLGGALARNQQNRRWERSAYPTDIDIIDELAKRVGLELDTTELLDTVNTLLFEKLTPDAKMQAQNDWLFFQKVMQENNAGFITDGRKVTIYDNETVKREQPGYRFRFWNQMQDEFDIPMVNFNANPIGVFFNSPDTKTTCARSTNFDKNEVEEKAHDAQTDETLTTTGAQSQAGNTAKGETVSTPAGNVTPGPVVENAAGVYITLPPDHDSKEELGKQIMRAGAVMANTHAKITAVGVPSITPHIMVLVDCGIPSFGGLYFVMKVTHTVGGNGYDMELELIRTGMPKPTANTQKPAGPKVVTTEKMAASRTPEKTEVQP